jgi:hypothetical protein
MVIGRKKRGGGERNRVRYQELIHSRLKGIHDRRVGKYLLSTDLEYVLLMMMRAGWLWE